MVAPSYQNYEILGEPYEKNKRLYVNVKTPKGVTKEVRWYSDKEYAKAYSKSTLANFIQETKPARERFKFDKQGFIYIFKPVEQLTKEEHEWLWANYLTAQTTGWWNWGWPPDVPFPDDMPKTLKPIKLEWEAVGNSDGQLKTDEEIKNAISNARKSNLL